MSGLACGRRVHVWFGVCDHCFNGKNPLSGSSIERCNANKLEGVIRATVKFKKVKVTDVFHIFAGCRKEHTAVRLGYPVNREVGVCARVGGLAERARIIDSK